MKVAGIRSTECREFLDKLQLPIAPLEKLGTEISLGARRRSLDKANPDEEQGVRFLDDLELACATRAQLLVSDEKRSEEHTSELQSLMRISYAGFCLKKQQHIHTRAHTLLSV